MLKVTVPLAEAGNCAFTCWLDTNSNGAGTPFTARHEPASAVGSGICEVAMFTGLICWP